MQIDDQELRQAGCTVIPDLVDSAALSVFHDEINAFATRILKRRGLVQKTNNPLTDLLQNSGEYRRQLFPLLKGLVSYQRIQAQVFERVSGSDFCKRMGFVRPTITHGFKADLPGESKYLLPLHQDYGTPCHRAYRFWIPLQDAAETSGTMRYVAGSHKAGFIEHDDSNPELPQVSQDQVGEGTFEVLELAAGSAFVFHPLLLHASVPATQDHIKFVLLMNVWDLDTLVDPEDETDPINQRLLMFQKRDQVRGDRVPVKIGAAKSDG